MKNMCGLIVVVGALFCCAHVLDADVYERKDVYGRGAADVGEAKKEGDEFFSGQDAFDVPGFVDQGVDEEPVADGFQDEAGMQGVMDEVMGGGMGGDFMGGTGLAMPSGGEGGSGDDSGEGSKGGSSGMGFPDVTKTPGPVPEPVPQPYPTTGVTAPKGKSVSAIKEGAGQEPKKSLRSEDLPEEDDSDLKLLQLQNEMQKNSRKTSILTNMMKQSHDTEKSIINNLK
jgi:hypothetical protein